MRFNWDAIIPAVALMHDDPAIPPIAGTGFAVERKGPDEYTVHLKKLGQPTEQTEPQAPPAA